MRNPIRNIISSSTNSVTDGVFLASDNERYVNAFDPQTRNLVMNLVAEKDVRSLSLYSGATKATGGNVLPLEKQALAAVTEDGTVELFTKPFSRRNESQDTKSSASLKARSKQMIRRADASVKVLRSENSEALVPVVTASFQGPELVIAWADGGVLPVFERIRWLEDNTEELSFTGTKTVVKSKSGSALGNAVTNGVKSADESHVDESRAVVESGNLAEDDVVMEDSKQDAASASASDSEDDSDDDTRESKKPKNKAEKGSTQKQKEDAADSDVEMQNAEESQQQQKPGHQEGEEAGAGAGAEEEEEGDETGEPSFGELLKANASQQEIDVEAELEDDVPMGPLGALKKPTASAVSQIPSGVSLSTVLAQSLKTNDNDMLESCFHTGDFSIIRTTIQRLDSSLAATLLQKLAERLSSRPGRYGHLLIWVQWTCVAHGGALAGKPELLNRMTTLFKVMDQRSSSLSSLLLLKGKLDMLDAQLGLRQSLRTGAEGLDSDDEDQVIYVEGQDEDEDEEEDEDGEADKDKTSAAAAAAPVTPRTKSIRNQTFDEDESMMNGIADESENDDEDEDGDDEEGEGEGEGEGDAEGDNTLLDTEAEESVGSSDAEESPEENEDDDDEEDSAGSMVDFIANSEEDEESEGEGEAENEGPQHSSKKAKVQGSGGGKGKSKSKK